MIEDQKPCPCCTEFFPQGCPDPAPGIARTECIVSECECDALEEQLLCEDCYMWSK